MNSRELIWTNHSYERAKERLNLSDHELEALEYYIELGSKDLNENGTFLIHSKSTGFGAIVIIKGMKLFVKTVLPRAKKHWTKSSNEKQIFVETFTKIIYVRLH